ncbi:Isoleucyl-tRNA synthetase [Caldalkalibacillus thermarum TA2.A1]|uniref:Isoleucine--tRNA ligase n=1 Tax=Caldalkalibacillus thermarum (strain TA2.A1) TaxID=986075 RepID=F5L920_CALTT|nr:isoleucine--tRNA ligase [Caldalkalibacillus thermarum]EGL82194.1 Isoleucyl-tRNA synthetase [Caldalkalibacillus thermarum TA2.A1]QZT33094.1 isoleucine--tRNA ligase [Caldalkalibacillus thermarum TA2.A1]
MDYRETLQVMKTDFPMRANLPKREPEIQKWWDEIDIYRKVQERTKGRPTYILHDGPPYANGDIHVGHALNKVLKDIVVRYKSMTGYHAPYVPGWDTHGLPIEHAVIKNEKVDRKKVGIIKFRQLCKQYAEKYINRQREQFKRLGVLGDWDNPYITFQPEYEARQIKVFGEMAKKGYIYKGLKPVYWSPSSESALAEAEIEYKDKRSPSIYVAFKVKDGKGKLDEDTEVVIWTTTPWTIPANLAIAVHPEFEYAQIRVKGQKYLVAKGLLEQLEKELEWEGYELLKTFKGEELEYVITRHPLYDRESPVILGEHVTLESGTGCVHTAPGHGEEDFYVGQKYNLGVLSPIDDRGYFTEEAPGFEGLFYDEANKVITQKLDEAGALLKLSFITHSYPHDWRSKKPVIFRATEQWFASIDGFREQMLEEIKKVKWVPAWGETRIYNMVRDRGDWCISRQRVWGVPIPIFYCQECHKEIITDETIEHVSNIFLKEGSDAWYEKEEQELLLEGFKCPHCGSTSFKKEMDTMDVWFDSGSSHEAVLKQREDLTWPADLYLEGTDQSRGWFNSSLSTSVAVNGQAPYKTVLGHGFTLDGEGRKMSKSLGNVIVPQKVMDQLGADILRLWVSSVEYTQDVRISDEILKQIAEVYRKIRNTLRFMLGNLADFDPEKDRVAREDWSELDRFIMLKAQQVLKRVRQAYEDFQFHTVYTTIHNFCTIELSAFYLDVSKDLLYTEAPQSTARRATQTVIYDILTMLVKLLTPIIPHTTEEVWKFIPGVQEESVQLTDFPEVDESYFDEGLEQKWNAFMKARDEVLKALEVARKEKVIGSSLGAKVHIYPDKANYELLKQFTNLDKLFIVSQVNLHGHEDKAPDNALSLEGMKVHVQPAEGEKCERCWVVTPDRGQDKQHPTLCPRCASIVNEHYQHLIQA